MNLPAHILTREHHNMNLPTHIITCSSPIMNLPTHDNIKHIPNQDQHNKPCKIYHKRTLPLHHRLRQLKRH